MTKTDKHIKILIVNGINLGQLGTREINIYGHVSFEDYLSELRSLFSEIQIDYVQSDDVGYLSNTIAHANYYHGIVLNAGAYTHTSMAIADSVRATTCPVIEVHISNLFGREQYRRHSVLSEHCAGFICGFGLDGYRLAIEAILFRKKLNS